jgi:succinylglutamate desuccinylase
VTTVTPRELTHERFLGRVHGPTPGPTLIISGGIHGNEPAGIVAAQRVIAHLRGNDISIRGDLIAVAGNLDALEMGWRFVDHDLNRVWTEDRVNELRASDPALDNAEQRQQRELLGIFEEYRGRSRGQTIILDLHTTSAGGPPFCLFSDTLANRRIATRLGVPLILGLEECIDGTLLDYATKSGMNAFVVEGGQHDDKASEGYHEAAIWLTLRALEMLPDSGVPDEAACRAKLAGSTAGLPRALEVRYRHPVRDTDGFEMRPGYIGFQRIQEGEHLASDRGGAIYAREGGRVLMPLYQELGEDGFFVIREIHTFWLHVSTFARQIGLPGVVPLLPGVRRHPERRDWILANKSTVRFFRTEVFHLLGFRTHHEVGDAIVFARRRRMG